MVEPTREQAAVVAAAPSEDLKVAAMAGTGKALRADQPVLADGGYRGIGTLRPGMEVFGSDGLLHKVLGVYPQGKRELFKVRFSDGTEVVADGDHWWRVERLGDRYEGQGRTRVMTTLGLAGKLTTPSRGTRDGRAYWFMPMTEPVACMESVLVPELDPWFLGVLLGDGCLTGGTVRLSSADAQIIEAVRSLLVPIGVDVAYVGSGVDYALTAHGLTIPGRRGFVNPLKDVLRRIGILGFGSLDKFVPVEYKLGGPETRLAVLQGLFDTDGSRSGEAVEYGTSSRLLAHDVKFMVETLGGTATLAERETASGNPGWRLYVKMPRGMAPFRLERKAAGWGGGQRAAYRTIESIEPAGIDEAVCIEVDAPNHLYLTAGCIPTHNTSTLQMGGEAWPRSRERLLYLAFNKKTADEAARRMPRNTESRTAHSLAYRAIGVRGSGWERKLALRPRASEVADWLGIPGDGGFGRTRWNATAAVRQTMRNYTHSADEVVSAHHVSATHVMAVVDEQTRLSYASWCLSMARKLWEATRNPSEERVALSHDDYLKIFQLSDPRILADVIMFDEFQDADPVVLWIVMRQLGRARVVAVGDENQAVYSWRGAVNAMGRFDVRELPLSESFRFGPEIAAAASDVLAWRGEVRTLTGRGLSDGMVGVGAVDRSRPHAVVCRSNHGVFLAALEAVQARRTISVIGGLETQIQVIEGAYWLLCENNPGMVQAPTLKPYQSAEELVSAAEDDWTLTALVKIVQRYGREVLSMCGTLRQAGDAGRDADVTISTCHKAKGLEWPQVVLRDDFRTPIEAAAAGVPLGDEELNLLYVGATRARERLETNDAVEQLRSGEGLLETLRGVVAAKPSERLEAFMARYEATVRQREAVAA